MSLLAPLYIAGLIAVSLPILFHLIRRAPQGRQAFSSLMFLSPSPPRLTRRSRLSNIVLLLLRAAALGLLAFAFARPFFQREAEAGANSAQGRRVALLVDTSASMRRGDLWRQAVAAAERALAEIGPADEVGLFFFDRQVRPGMTFAEWNDLQPAQRSAMLRARLAEAAPTWAGTNLGEALATTADLLAEAEGGRGKAASPAQAASAPSPPPAAARQLVLISDLQQGGHVEALQGHQWPANVVLEVRPVAAQETSNAAMQVVKEATEDAAGPDAARRLRVRVANQPDAKREQFTLTWADARGPLAGVEPVNVYVPPGRSHVARIAWPATQRGADRLVLSGDAVDFDNTLFVARPGKDAVRVVFVGDDAADDPRGLHYYLRNAAADTPRRTVEILARRGGGEPLAQADLLGARLVVVSGGAALDAGRTAALRKFAEGGGDVLWVLTDASASIPLKRLLQTDTLRVEEAAVAAGEHALIGRVELDHPLFAPFADPRFGDFTKIHFWKHRRLTLPPPGQTNPAPRVLARFDNGDPFLLEQVVGRGRVFVMTSGWHQADSQLALSTKFVPLIDGLLRRRDQVAIEPSYAVHEPIPLPRAEADASGGGGPTVLDPDGREMALPRAAGNFVGADRPGIYRLRVGGGQPDVPLVVNLAPDESRTAPLAIEDLERWGARVGGQALPEEIVTRQRQLQRAELENGQKLWQALLVGVLGLLAAETALAGRLARRATEQQVTT